MRRSKKGTLLLAVILLLAIFSLPGCSTKSENGAGADKNSAGQNLKYEGQSLLVYSGAGLSLAMDEIGQTFTEKYGCKVNYNYAGCAQLLGQMELSKNGDIFVGGSLNDMDIAKQKGFTDEFHEVVYHIPAIAVPKDNPAQIKELSDLAKPGIKLVLGDEKSNVIGKKGAMIFAKNGLEEGIASNVVARTATVNEIITHIAMKQGDAALVWEDSAAASADIEIIPIAKEQNIIDKVPVCVLNFTEKQELAQEFAAFVNSEEGRAIFAKYGFKPVE